MDYRRDRCREEPDLEESEMAASKMDHQSFFVRVHEKIVLIIREL